MTFRMLAAVALLHVLPSVAGDGSMSSPNGYPVAVSDGLERFTVFTPGSHFVNAVLGELGQMLSSPFGTSDVQGSETQMLPGLTVEGVSESDIRHSQFLGNSGDCFTGGHPGVGRTDLIVGQLRMTLSSTSWWVGPPLGVHVPHVVGGSSEKEMIGVAAQSDITPMEGEQPFGDWTFGERPCVSVRKPLGPAPGESITVISNGPCPQPASVVLMIESSPEDVLPGLVMLWIDAASVPAGVSDLNPDGPSGLFEDPSSCEDYLLSCPELRDLAALPDPVTTYNDDLTHKLLGQIHDSTVGNFDKGVNS